VDGNAELFDSVKTAITKLGLFCLKKREHSSAGSFRQEWHAPDSVHHAVNFSLLFIQNGISPFALIQEEFDTLKLAQHGRDAREWKIGQGPRPAVAYHQVNEMIGVEIVPFRFFPNRSEIPGCSEFCDPRDGELRRSGLCLEFPKVRR
jgi:hypothetical protein